jgi:hypothetical protein
MERKPEYFGDWWAIISTFEKVMWIIAVVASVLFLFQMFMFYNSFLQGDEDETDVENSSTYIENLVSYKSWVIFFTFFSWGALYAYSNFGFGTVLSTLSGIVGGILLSLGFAYIFTYFDSSGD